MLNVTTNAAQAIKTMASDVPDGGLRISPGAGDREQAALEVAVVGAPAASDEVISEEGSRVFLDEQVAPLLDGKTLDAEVTDRGVRFTVVG